MTIHVPAANAKFDHLCAVCAAGGGTLKNPKTVATAVGVTEGRISQLFRGPRAEAEKSIKPELLGNIIRVFCDQGVNVTVNDLCNKTFEEFATAISYQDASCLKLLSRPPSDEIETGQEARKGDWVINKAVANTRLAVVRLHPPRQLNSRSDCFHLDVSIRFEPAEYSYEEKTLLVGLCRAVATFESPAYQIAHNSLLGDGERNWEGVVAGNNGVTLKPTLRAKMLTGSPLGDHHLAIIEPAGNGDAKVTVELEAPRRAFVFKLLDDKVSLDDNVALDDNVDSASSISPNKMAILNLVYGESLSQKFNSETNRYGLAQASMQYLPISDDNEK